MKRLPDNIADFQTLIEDNYIYVDKTPQIHQLLTGSGRNFFLSRPRRFGKTLLVSTLEQIFLGNRDLFKGLWIDQSDYTWPKHPVIRISMAGLDCRTHKRFETSLSRRLNEIATANSVQILSKDSSPDQFRELILRLAAQNSVVVLIDEYDYPILNHLHKPQLAESMREALKAFYGILKDLDKQLRFLFFTGVTKFNKTSIFSGINNLKELTFNEKAATLLGLTFEELTIYFQEHIQINAQKYGLSSADFLRQLQEWYNGYRFSPYSEEKVYNPCSVIRCLLDGHFENYWSQTGTPSFLVKLIKEKNYPVLDIENLKLSEEDLGTFDINQIQLPTLLFQAGYLTIKSYDSRTQNFHLSYPNKEVSETMMKVLAPIITGQSSFASWQTLAADLKDALQTNDIKMFCELLRPFFADIPYDLHIPLERYYQTVFYMLVKFMGAEIITEERTNIGRIDVVLQTHTHVYVIELKMGKSAPEALEQIRQRQYGQKYGLLNKSLMAIGLAFDPKSRNIVDQAWETL